MRERIKSITEERSRISIKRQQSIARHLQQWCTQEFFFGGEGVQQIQLTREDRENGDVGTVAPLVRGSGGSCNLVQEISFYIVKFS